MKITKEIEKLIKMGSASINKNTSHEVPNADWSGWIRNGLKSNQYPWSCSSELEFIGHQVIDQILIASGNESMIGKFAYEEDTEEFKKKWNEK